MLPEIGASELLVIAVVALIVVGPKDLPVLLRKLGQGMAKLRGMAAEFRASFDEMARQSELDELRREVEEMRRGQFVDAATSASQAEIHQTLGDIHEGLSPQTPAAPPISPPDTELASEPAAAAPAARAAAVRRRPRPAKAPGPEQAKAASKRAPAKRKPKAAPEADA